MKKTILLLLLPLIFVSCGESKVSKTTETPKNEINNIVETAKKDIDVIAKEAKDKIDNITDTTIDTEVVTKNEESNNESTPNKEADPNEVIDTTPEEEIISNTDKEEKTGEYCLLDLCAPKDLKYTTEGDYLIASEQGEFEEQGVSYKVSKDETFIEKEVSQPMQRTNTRMLKIGDYYIKVDIQFNCGGDSITQKVLDKNGKEVKDFFTANNKNKLKIGNIEYSPTLNLEGRFDSPDGRFNDYFYYKNGKDISFESDKKFFDFVENMALKEDKKLYDKYIGEFKDYQGIYIAYEAPSYDNKSFRIVWLGKDKEYLNKNIKENGDFYDLAITNKIVGYYSGKNVAEGVFNSTDNRIEKVTKEDLPLFKMVKLNEDGNYLVYFKKGYKLQSFAEMCKPVVYYYSKDKEENKLSLNLKDGDYFTKLIPELDKDNTWEFSAEDDKINVKGKEYDYLYYSLVTLGYAHNHNGWIVKGDEVVDFFNDKLDKINFNKTEKRDFIDFWKNEYEPEKYYFISFKYKEELDKIVKLEFNSKVENQFRILLDSYELQDFTYDRYEEFLYSKVGNKFDKVLIKKFNRGNTFNEVFEWGGVLQKENETIIK